MPIKCLLPIISIGAILLSDKLISAPINRKGSATRNMGRRIKDSSPIKMELNFCADNKPHNNRMDVPELPQFNGVFEDFNPCNPTPCTRADFFSRSKIISTQSACIILTVDNTSSLNNIFSICFTPFAIDDKIIARCEMDLSPGTLISPEITLVGETC